MSDIKLTLTLDEVNHVLGALGDRPFIQVVDLITKVRTQAQSQVPEQKADMVADELVG
jgi:hypothetical protein